MIGKHVKLVCCEDISLIENYWQALNDTSEIWHCHHKNEIILHKTSSELKKIGLYFNVPAKDLIFLKPSDHSKLHGDNVLQTTRDKLSTSLLGKPSWIKGKHHSEETKEKLSRIFKGCTNEKNRGVNNGMYGKHPTNSKKVYQYTKEWEFVKEWESCGYAEKTLRICNIVRVCEGKSHTAGGYRWSYTKI